MGEEGDECHLSKKMKRELAKKICQAAKQVDLSSLCDSSFEISDEISELEPFLYRGSQWTDEETWAIPLPPEAIATIILWMADDYINGDGYPRFENSSPLRSHRVNGRRITF